jgi:transglutaminase-like putative cysteine protease
MNNSEITRERWWDFPSALILIAAILAAATRLVVTRWTDHLGITQTIGLFAILAGYAFGQSRFSIRTVLAFSTVYGTSIIGWQLGMTIKGDNLLWMERLEILFNRLLVVINEIISRDPVSDSILFLIGMAILFWILGTHAGFTLTRTGEAWWSALPTGAALFMIHSFDSLIALRAWYLAVYLFFTLVLVARMEYLKNQNRWQSVRSALPPHLSLDFTRSILFATALIVLIAWTIPFLGNALPVAQKMWQPVQLVWNDFKKGFEDFFAPLRSTVTLVSQVYGANMNLGLGSPLSDNQIFAVRAPASLPPSIRLYWRARTYETYVNGQWYSNNLRSRAFSPERDEISSTSEFGRWLGSFDFIAVAPIATIFTPAQPLWVNQPAQMEYFMNPDDSWDITTFRARDALQPGIVYTVQASLSYATVAQLQSMGSDYPEWVTDRYLQIPNSVTERTRQLAEEITFGLETPYDKVTAITNYLRKNITYVEVIEDRLPENQELIDWFLFDYKQGFCNYYATAEVILLRSIGIPARLSVGYAQGERIQSVDTRQDNYVVRQRNAHAWPEVYFQEIGWVEFEPTVSEPQIVRLPGISESSVANPNFPISDDQEEQLRREMEEELALLRNEREGLTPSTEEQRRMPTVVYWIGIVGFGALAFLSMRWLRKRGALPPAPIVLERMFQRAGLKPPKTIRVWAEQSRLPPLSRAYLEINYALQRLGQKPQNTHTPTERASMLAQALPEARKPANKLVHEYQVETFSRQPANMAVAYKAAIEIKDLSIKAYFQRLLSRIQRKPHG